jgi:heptosyltransferase-3
VELSRARRRLERWGRAALVWLLGLLLPVRRRPVVLGPTPRILVVRLDERVGNLILVTPLLSSLRARFAGAEIELLAHARIGELVAQHPALGRLLAFDKRSLFSREGPLAAPFRLRRRRYDVAIDAANPTDPSTTQAILVRLSGAPHTVGFAEGDFARFYSAAVSGRGAGPHEIDMRLALLNALPGTARLRGTSLGLRARPRRVGLERGQAVLNVGARLDDKRLSVETYAAIARRVMALGVKCVVTYGPAEERLAAEVADKAEGAVLGPPTSLMELAALFATARLVVTCDTGPMHLAVAAGAPTCGIFVSTDPERYGYREPPHAAVDARGRRELAWLAEMDRWLEAELGIGHSGGAGGS